MTLRLLAIGKKHEPWVSEGINRYEKRLQKPFTTSWTLLPHSSREGEAARHEESVRLREKISPDDFVVLLDERGTLLASPNVAKLLQLPLDRSQAVVIVIGGAYGIDETMRQRAQVVWSLSPLVFPHQLVRLLLVEQIYRAQEIIAGRSYHHS